jgi:ABC-2 type transport system permease protein
MSRAEALEVAADRAAPDGSAIESVPGLRSRPLWGARFVRSELGMIFRRRRNLAMLAVLGAIPIVIAVAVKLTGTGSDRGPSDAGALFANITSNGVFVGLSALFVVLPLFLPMTVSVIAGEAVAGEAHTGTLRYLLIVPVGRTRLLVAKYLGVLVWCVVSAVTVAVSGVIIGLILFGGGDVTLLSGTSVSFGAGLVRMLYIVGYVAAMVAAIGAIGLFVSTLTEVPIAAMATTLVLAITSQVLDAVPQLHAIQPWLPSHYWLRFADLLRDPMALSGVGHGLLVALGYLAVFLSLAWARFGGKDVTS